MNEENNKKPIDPGINGDTTEALIQGDFSVAVRKERSIELIAKIMKAVTDGTGDIVPIVMGVRNGQIFSEECIVDPEGNITLPELKLNTKEDLDLKSKMIRRIMKHITPVLKSDIENVTYMALMRKDANKLSEVLKALKDKNIKPRLQNRAGCIWVIIGEYEFII